MGAVVDPALPQRPEYRALGPNLYGGTAGVGLFLAQLGAVTGDAAVRRTAVGAFRHAIARASSLPPARRDGFHAGPVGIAWATVRGAALLDEEELHAGGRAVLGDAPVPGPDRWPDLVKGCAGAIVGLLALSAAFDDPKLLEQAQATGDELLGRATVRRPGWSWETPGRRYPNHLCGISHGAAGIGWALLELFAATGEARFRAGAEEAFVYERSWLDANAGAWPDLRMVGQSRRTPRAIASPAEGTWCHGEAGIAMTRLRAIAVLGSGPHAQDADIALETTRQHLGEALPYEIADFSLCHGASGAADVLLCAADALGARWRPAAAVAADVGHVALERRALTRAGGPCGAPGTTPDLFLGLSGIAWFLLRLHDHTIPSPLAMPIHG